MRLNPEEKSCLEALYNYYAIPTDQLRRNHVVLGRITVTFHRITGRDEDASEILRYMINRRKNKDWACLGERARRFPPALRELLDGEIGVLSDIYEAINIPLDEYLLRNELTRQLAAAFTARAKRFVPAATLVAALMARRKRGLLLCLEEERKAATRRPFADIQEVALKHQNASYR